MIEREEFEVKFPMPDYVRWADKHGVYAPLDWGDRTHEELCIRYNCRFDGWKAGRESMKEELAAAKAKHYEECAVIAKSCDFGVTKNFVADAIRAALTDTPAGPQHSERKP